MFGSGFALPNMTDMIKQVEDFKSLVERLTSATENNTRKLDLIMAHLGIDDPATAIALIEDEPK